MNPMRLLSAVLLVAALPASAKTSDGSMDGAWTVDLSSKPGEVYTKPMVLTLKEDGTVTGLFYQSDIEAGRWEKDRGRTCVSFRTTDSVGPYHSAACRVGDHVEGQTWAEKRNFLFNWNATRTVVKK